MEMNIESLSQGIIEKETISRSVHLCFTPLEHERWMNLKARLKIINQKLKIQEFGRIALREMMDNVESLIIIHEEKLNKTAE